MDQNELKLFRKKLGKTQEQMAVLLGISVRAIQSFEQGWRIIPVHVERQSLFMHALKMEAQKRLDPCWKIRHCPPKVREICPAWEFKIGPLCWFINGTVCHGKPQESWNEKMAICRKCEVFVSFMKHCGLYPVNRNAQRRKTKIEN